MGCLLEVAQSLETGSSWCIGPRARRLFSYIGVLARGWAAYVGPKLVKFGVLGLLCWPNGCEACIWEGQNSDFEESCIVLSHFEVLKWRHVKRGVANIRVHRALAREAS